MVRGKIGSVPGGRIRDLLTMGSFPPHIFGLLIGADWWCPGLHRIARELVVGKASQPIPTGQLAYRITIPARGFPGIEELEDIVTVPRNNNWLGLKGTVSSYLLVGEKPLMNLVLTLYSL